MAIDGVGFGLTDGIAVADGVGDGELGVALSFGFGAVIEVIELFFQINFFPDLVQVSLVLDCTVVCPIFEQLPPTFTAANKGLELAK